MKAFFPSKPLLEFLFDHSSNTCSATKDLQFSFKDYAVQELNAFLWLALILITALLLRQLIKILHLWAKGRNLPGPPCPSFFFGHSKLFSTTETLSDFLAKSHDKYDSIVRLWLGPTLLLVSVVDPEVIKEMLVKAEDKLPFTERLFRRAFGRSILFASSFEEEVNSRRKSLAVQLNGKSIEQTNAIHSKVVDSVMERTNSIMTKGILDCKSFSQHMSFTVLGATLFGEEFLAWSNATLYEEILMKIAKDACFWASYSIPPFWKRSFWEYKCLCRRLKGLTQDIVKQHKQKYKVGQLDQNPNNEARNIDRAAVIDAVVTWGTVTEDGLLEKFDDQLTPREDPWGDIMGVMFHGCLTNAGLIGNLLTRLVMHQEIQTKIYSEIAMARSKSTMSEKYDVQSMNFLLATVYESARLLQAGPLLQRCSMKHELNLNDDITVPAGAILVVPVQLVQMEGSSWGSDACQFNPHRFLSNTAMRSESKPIVPITGTAELMGPDGGPFVFNEPNANAAFLPFGSGTRACLGQKLAIVGIATLFAYLLECYEIRLQPGSDDDPKPTVKNCVFQPLPSPNIIFIKRKN